VSSPTLADSAAAPVPSQDTDADLDARSGDPAGRAGAADSGSPAPDPDGRTCSNCGAKLEDGQDWCLNCGSGTPDSLGSGGPGWRSATTVLAITGALVLGAAAAGYAALSKSSPRRPAQRVITVAQAPPTVLPGTPGASTPGTGTPGTSTPGAGVPGTSTPGASVPSTGVPAAGVPAPAPVKPLEGKTTLPKIPLTAPTPKPAQTTPSKTGTGTGTTPSKSSTEHEPAEPAEPTPMLLDTNAAATYNPYHYPASEFGDPGLAIDDEASTAWTARVNPAVAPRMAEGLSINLNSDQKVGELALITSTPGMIVQVYGATGSTLPGSIVDPGWIPLSSPLAAKRGKTHIKLHDSTTGFHYVLLWISEAPASAVGTPKAPGHVAVNELELFPAQ
jgi:hypothetical protein